MRDLHNSLDVLKVIAPTSSTDTTPLVGTIVDTLNYSSLEFIIQYSALTDPAQTVTITGTPTGGTFTLTFVHPTTAVSETTGNIAYDATAATVATALKALDGIGTSDVGVTGNAGGPYTVAWASALANLPVAAMTASGAGLTGGTNPAVTVAKATAITFTPLVEDGNNSALSDNAAVADSDLLGTEALATATYDDDNEIMRIGYVGDKRYVRLTITPANAAGTTYLGAYAIAEKRIKT